MRPWMWGMISFGVLGAMYIGLMVLSMRGFGYVGYNGYDEGPSWFYFSDVKTQRSPSVRSGSRGGPSVHGGGIHSGK
jgi:hypothetical protein